MSSGLIQSNGGRVNLYNQSFTSSGGDRGTSSADVFCDDDEDILLRGRPWSAAQHSDSPHTSRHHQYKHREEKRKRQPQQRQQQNGSGEGTASSYKKHRGSTEGSGSGYKQSRCFLRPDTMAAQDVRHRIAAAHPGASCASSQGLHSSNIIARCRD